jgi:hypothetical protein
MSALPCSQQLRIEVAENATSREPLVIGEQKSLYEDLFAAYTLPECEKVSLSWMEYGEDAGLRNCRELFDPFKLGRAISQTKQRD